MRFIPVNVHNILDYIYGTLIIAAPWLFGFQSGGAETYLLVIAGALVILISLITNYRYSLAKIVSLKAHLVADLVIGIFLVLSPRLFGFYEYVYIPHLAFGIFAAAVSLMTERKAAYKEY